MSIEIDMAVCADNRLVMFNNRESIDVYVKQSGVNTLHGFNTLAVMAVKHLGADIGVEIVPGEESLWTLGTLNEDDGVYLASLLLESEEPEVVKVESVQ